jgi:hypothetical protein
MQRSYWFFAIKKKLDPRGYDGPRALFQEEDDLLTQIQKISEPLRIRKKEIGE